MQGGRVIFMVRLEVMPLINVGASRPRVWSALSFTGGSMALGREEINRKLLHILSGSMIPAGIFYLPMIPGIGRWFPAILLGIITTTSVVIEFLRFRYPAVQNLFYRVAGHSLRKAEERKVTGATYIFAAGVLCAFAFVEQPHIAFIALCLFILGDAAAALVGQSIGRIRIGAKSLEGTIGCLVMCLLLCLVVFPLVPRLLDTWGGRMPLALVIVVCLLTSILELFPFSFRGREINDNLSVPLLTGMVMKYSAPLFT